MFNEKVINGKNVLVFEDFVYDNEIDKWVHIDEYTAQSNEDEVVNENNVEIGQSTII